MKNNNLVKLFNKQKPTAGYTLMELLIGASISVVVIGAAGMGLMNLMRGNLTATNQAERRAEVNRALEFISDEVRKAETIELDPVNHIPTGFTLTGQAILALDIPDNLGQSNAGDKVIYYVRPKPSTGGWIGPNVIYRYGPPLDTNGSYTNGGWTPQPLIDRISDQTITPSCTGAQTAIAAQGFAACVSNQEKIAKLFVNGKFSEDSADEYKADIQVFARAEAENLTGSSSGITFSMTSGGGGTPTNPTNIKVIKSSMGCSTSPTAYTNGTGKCTITTKIQKTNGDVDTIDSQNSEGTDVSVGTDSPFKIVITPSTKDVPSPFISYFGDNGEATYNSAGAQNNSKAITIDVDLSKDYLNTDPATLDPTLNSYFSQKQIVLLGDGDNISDVGPWNLDGAEGSKFEALQAILSEYIDSNGNIKLEPNQYILAVEVGQLYDSTKDANGNGLVDKDEQHPGFDLQDQVLLITVP